MENRTSEKLAKVKSISNMHGPAITAFQRLITSMLIHYDGKNVVLLMLQWFVILS